MKKFLKFLESILRRKSDCEDDHNLYRWAETEVALAKDNEGDDYFSEYGRRCFDSALKAYKSLVGDSHSGFSIGITQDILNQLIDGKPLTPIEDVQDAWMPFLNHEDGCSSYQSKRMSSLFKDVFDDGRVRYYDTRACYCVDVDTGVTYGSGFISNLYNDMFPIEMPYMPSGAAKVEVKESQIGRASCRERVASPV